MTRVFDVEFGEKPRAEQGVHLNIADGSHRDLGKERAKRFRWISGLRGPRLVIYVLQKPPATRTSARVHCVPEEGWSPAEPEHWGEAPRRCCSSLRCVVRCASPPVAERVCARVAATGRGGRRAREQDHRRAIVFALRWCEVAVAPCRVSSADDDVDDRCRDHDDDSASDHDDDSTTADDHHDDDSTTTATDHYDDDRHRRRRRRTVRAVRPRGTRPHRTGTAPARRSRSAPCSPS